MFCSFYAAKIVLLGVYTVFKSHVYHWATFFLLLYEESTVIILQINVEIALEGLLVNKDIFSSVTANTGK